MNEKAYLAKIRKGDIDALNAFIEELYPPVYRYVYCRVSGKEEAKDITQEVFIRFTKQLSSYKSDGKVLAYLYTIAMNCCRSYYRKEQRHHSVEWHEELCGDTHNVSEEVLDNLQFEELKYYLRQLDDKDQNVLIFHYLKQMTFKEIADLTKENEATIKSRHYRALQKIRILMKEGDSHATKN